MVVDGYYANYFGGVTVSTVSTPVARSRGFSTVGILLVRWFYVLVYLFLCCLSVTSYGGVFNGFLVFVTVRYWKLLLDGVRTVLGRATKPSATTLVVVLFISMV